jgi:hypothetical protein
VYANATDTGGSGINYVEFWNGSVGSGVLLGNDTDGPSPLYEATWNTLLAADGAHTLYIRAVDQVGNALNSTGIAVTIDNTAPTQADITSPVNDSYLRGWLWIYANVSDATGTGINYTEFYVGHPSTGTLIGTNYTSPICSINWSTIAFPGNVLLYLKTVDMTGNELISSPANVTVDNTIPSSCNIINPAVSGTNQSGVLSLQASAIDIGTGIDYVEFWNGTPGLGAFIGNDTTPPSPFVYGWDTTSWADGYYEIYARAFDMAGNLRISQLSF